MEIGEIKKTSAVVTKIRLTEFKGRNFLDIRDFFKPKGSVDFTPTKKGIALEYNKIAELISLIEIAETEAAKAGQK